MHQQKGFTFIELIVVIAIASIISGIAVPVYFKIKPSMQINGAARQIMGDLMWARMKAVSENNDFVVTFGSTKSDLSNNSYSIYDDNDGDYSVNGVEAGELIKTVVIPNIYEGIGYGGTNTVVTFNSGGATRPRWLSFRSNGTANIAGSIYIIPEEDEVNGVMKKSRAIRVIQTGRVKIKHYNMVADIWE